MEQKRGSLQQYGATFEMLLADVDDHYRTLRILERYLKNPDKLSTQLDLQISPDQQNMLIEKLISASDVSQLLIFTFSHLSYIAVVYITFQAIIFLKVCLSVRKLANATL